MFEVAEPLAGVVGAEFGGDCLGRDWQQAFRVCGDGPVGAGGEAGLVLGSAGDGAEGVVALLDGEAVVLQEGFDELLSATGLDFGEPGTSGSPTVPQWAPSVAG
ncbi:hypothetical protein [Streptomyces jumonjinensis]|uniref:hypothetical protein n=1 Tax=Streptomyces jumonjinensis TaxID=1945 RepID=UPI00379DE8CA